METKTQDGEKAQLLQTVEMFEAVTQSSPDDYQSLEILKEAYHKLGRGDDTLRVARQIARAYVNLGKISQAVLQYEGILQQSPKDAESSKALQELQKKLDASSGAGQSAADVSGNGNSDTATDLQAVKHDGDAPNGSLQRPNRLRPATTEGDGDELLCELIVKHGLLKEKVVKEVLHGVQGQNAQLGAEGVAVTLVQSFSDRGLLSPEQSLTFLSERSSLPFMPLSIYDVVPDVVRLQPRDISFKYCTIPFDRISRTLLMATANPFDERSKKASQKVLDYNLQWYVCSPVEITQILKDVYLVGKASAKDD